MSKKINTIAIIGAGTMGMGIATHFSIYGYTIHLFDAFPEAIEKAKTQIPSNYKSMLDLGEIDADQAKKGEEKVQYFSDLKAAVADADLVIESVPENKELKKKIFDDLDGYCREDAILASNTSGLKIYDFLEVKNPERLVITHFFVPAYVMPLVEIVRGPETSDETVAAVKALMDATGKSPAVVNKVIPGFIMNRLTFAIYREGAYMVDQGWCAPEDIDSAVRATHGSRYPFEGPFELVDFAGVDTYEKICENLLPELCNDSSVPKNLKDLFDKGDLGVKSGKGYFDYEDPTKSRAVRDRKIVKTIQSNRKIKDEFSD
ncbi:MAG: 3-hydroxyacyl-CoA dehydrogenase family protein [Christensenella sp.]|uniref:3-hydroxyacyl-CoA dehydrogenase family protein n=1 Tax=Christensenella sp. TaxID=1935934 RepID=UPI002B1EE407|nr:3-hydroxyacyl-CoA dehydrogenase family protein [Christensenella sp.]MEA5002505.1 3-hydroxyacyl-CoA dehydrogenase family protein [Christensenella sp.]